MTKRIFYSICLVAMGVVLASIVLFMGVLYDYFSNEQFKQLKVQTELASQGVKDEGVQYLSELDVTDYRITWIDTDGTVIYDSKSDTAEMENHLKREEIKQALSEGIGESSRYSSTLMERSLYCAKRLTDGTVLRLSIAQSTLLALVFGMIQPICIILIVAIILSIVLAFRLSERIVKPLNELNLDEPLKNDAYDELSPLIHRIALQQYQIRLQEDELQQKQSEFETVTTNMTEGIVLLNSKGSILSINKAALKLFGENDTCIGKDILTINHSLELQDILQKSENGIRSEKVVTLGNGKYQLAVSPILLNEQLSGTVILLLDVTEKEKVEQMRREFTANVSHELKTPLHLISGYSELLSNGIVKQEDITKFSTQIYTETKRMICLVEDILKLSHLDEGAEDMSFVEVNLYELAKDTLKMLSTQAEFTNVELILNGENTILYGIPQLLQGIIYNLCDNAIKYNRQGGSVTVVVKQENQNIILSVCDTGIGIPIEHQERIFERFYRVDKSHSKEIGGTGLGLSIVKHAVRLHNATIELFSEVNKGTTITVKFPVNNKIGF